MSAHHGPGKRALVGLARALGDARIKAIASTCESVTSRSAFYAYLDPERPTMTPNAVQLVEIATYAKEVGEAIIAAAGALEDAALFAEPVNILSPNPLASALLTSKKPPTDESRT
jgi:hypothetical protein